ncbi:conserved hypothetical protein [Pseudarthrobacter chlorophenolicus A6]|uniref:Uncharacterized protein n=1 Tax=Pseudarthrobacter chlorophenolicus (strain ATCC 700700 / DSM 12829 / CIP 107037 / JCM 12360 / KCTC 9906 / NCIMB 13794 / A6) TaxID=452863 RepID=B8HD47_PSECP|nr:hypothetical protein [Pseudarthrobacter chlorophenolicus]ACL40693.1 conserved hypothetical protein [Pseudarthrobacter chlorophenolicus A6]SDQ76783.1 hypothetical protein SAMN04489738_2755 [Pseudarthrobacter chlorophenolicus]
MQPTVILFPFLLAAGVYLLLRWVIWQPGNPGSADTAAKHALWIGVIGWLVSSLQPAAKAGLIPVSDVSEAPSAVELLPVLAWPVLGCLAVHAIGQLSYPGPRLPRRRASLDVRRIRDFLPRKLAWTVLAIFVTAAGQIAWTAGVPGFDPAPYVPRPEPSGGYVYYGGDGRVPGIDLAAPLGGALVVLAAGTFAVLALIARRRRLEWLSSEDNSLLRTIAMNRLLRTVATVASGLAAIAGNHAALTDPAEGTGNWASPAAMLNLVVLLAMWWWAPPKLSHGLTERRARRMTDPQPATKLVVSIGPAMGLAALIPLVAAAVMPGVLTGQPALFVALAAMAVLAVVAGGEVLLHRNYGTDREPRHWPRQPVSPALTTTVVAAAAILLGVIVLIAAWQAEAGAPPSWIAAVWTTAAAIGTAAVPFAVARRRRSIPATVRGLDAALRAITLHRVARTLAALFAAQAGALLMSAAPGLQRFSPPGADTTSVLWQVAPGAGVILAAAGVVIAVIPVRGISAKPASAAAPAPETVP